MKAVHFIKVLTNRMAYNKNTNRGYHDKGNKFVIAVALFLFYFRYDIYQQLAAVTFIFLIISLMIVMASLSKKLYFIPSYVIPFALLPIILRTFFDSRLAFFVHVNTIILAILHALIFPSLHSL